MEGHTPRTTAGAKCDAALRLAQETNVLLRQLVEGQAEQTRLTKELVELFRTLKVSGRPYLFGVHRHVNFNFSIYGLDKIFVSHVRREHCKENPSTRPEMEFCAKR